MTSFSTEQKAEVLNLATTAVMAILEELASRGGLPAPAGDVIAAMAARDYGARMIARFPHREAGDE